MILPKSLRINRVQHAGNAFVDRKQNPTREDRPPQPHCRPAPEPPHPAVDQDALRRLDDARAPGTLRAGLDRVERHGGIRRDDARHRPVGEVDHGVLLDLVGPLVVLEGVVGAHADRGRRRLLERCPAEAAVHAPEAVLTPDGAHGVQGRREAPGRVPGVVDEGRLDAFRGRHGGDARDHARAHAGEQVAAGREGAGVRVREGVLDRVVGEETHAVFGDRADDQGGAALVERAGALVLEDLADDGERVFGSRDALFLPELDSCLCKLERILKS